MLRRALLGLALLGATAAAAPVAAQGCDTRFRVVNGSSRTVQEFYFGSSRQRSWGTDRLGSGVMAPGQGAAYQSPVAGNHDFRVVWAGGRSAELMQVDLCAMSTLVVTDTGLAAQ